MGLKHYENKLKGTEKIVVLVDDSQRYYITLKELLGNCIDMKFGKALEAKMKNIEKNIIKKNIKEKKK